MTSDLAVDDKVGIKQGFTNAGSWGIVRSVHGGGEYHVAIEDDDNNVHTYIRTELRKWRTATPKSPEAASETSSKSTEGQLAPGQLPALRFDYVSLRTLNDSRMFLEVTFNGKPYLVAIEGLTYGTMADYVENNKPGD